MQAVVFFAQKRDDDEVVRLVEHERLFRVHPLGAMQNTAHPSTGSLKKQLFYRYESWV
jgi:hypothetical protein